jgi:hypothetical protein
LSKKYGVIIFFKKKEREEKWDIPRQAQPQTEPAFDIHWDLKQHLGHPASPTQSEKKKSENKNLPPVKNQINFFLRQIYLRTILSKSSQQIPAWLSNMAPVS